MDLLEKIALIGLGSLLTTAVLVAWRWKRTRAFLSRWQAKTKANLLAGWEKCRKKVAAGAKRIGAWQKAGRKITTASFRKAGQRLRACQRQAAVGAKRIGRWLKAGRSKCLVFMKSVKIRRLVGFCVFLALFFGSIGALIWVLWRGRQSEETMTARIFGWSMVGVIFLAVFILWSIKTIIERRRRKPAPTTVLPPPTATTPQGQGYGWLKPWTWPISAKLGLCCLLIMLDLYFLYNNSWNWWWGDNRALFWLTHVTVLFLTLLHWDSTSGAKKLVPLMTAIAVALLLISPISKHWDKVKEAWAGCSWPEIHIFSTTSSAVAAAPSRVHTETVEAPVGRWSDWVSTPLGVNWKVDWPAGTIGVENRAGRQRVWTKGQPVNIGETHGDWERIFRFQSREKRPITVTVQWQPIS